MAEEQDQSLSPSPFKVARLSSEVAAGGVTMAAPSPLVLGLGLGLGSHEGGKPAAAFTFMQMQELQHQALIYKYMTGGVPVPLQLVLPIWKTVAASSAGPHRFPTLMSWGSLCLDYRNSMEPEPGRCRRTDGKKWRCSRDVVPDQKYCERHVHRGRNRSRKPVEAPGGGGVAIASTSTTGATTTYLSMADPNFYKPSSSNGSPTRLGFSPSSVLYSALSKSGSIEGGAL